MLKYIGGGDFIPDLYGKCVPTRELSGDEVKELDEAILIASGLYVRPQDKPNPGNRQPRNKQPDLTDTNPVG